MSHTLEMINHEGDGKLQFDDMHDSPYGTSPVHSPFVSGIGDHYIQNYEPEGRDYYHMRV